MRHSYFALLLLVLLAPTPALAQRGAYTVQGQLSPQTPLTKIYLFKWGQENLDSATVRNGRFTLKGQVDAPTRATLLLAKPGYALRSAYATSSVPVQMLPLHLEPGTVQVVSPDSLPRAVLSGTPLNRDYQRLLEATKAPAAQLAALEAEWEAVPAEKQQNQAYKASFDRRREAPLAAYNALLKQFIQANPTSLISLYALEEYGFSLDPAVVSPLLAGLAPAVRQSPAGQTYASKLDKARQLAVGALAPDFTQNNPAGQPVKLSDFRGKYVLVDFWASWCGPCRAENPNVMATYHQYKSRNFTVLGVSLDRASNRDAWLKAIEADHLPWTQVLDPTGETKQLYGIQAIPQNFLIGPDGRIVAKDLRGEALGQKLAAVLPASAP